VRHRSRPREPEARAARNASGLGGVERRVGRHHDDAAPGGIAARALGSAERAAHRDAVDPPIRPGSEVREHDDADGRIRVAEEPARRADPALPAEAHHASARSDPALRDRPARLRGGERARRVVRLDLHRERVAEPAVVALRRRG